MSESHDDTSRRKTTRQQRYSDASSQGTLASSDHHFGGPSHEINEFLLKLAMDNQTLRRRVSELEGNVKQVMSKL